MAEIIDSEGVATIPKNGVLQILRNISGAFAGIAYVTKKKFNNYFLSSNGSVQWQVCDLYPSFDNKIDNTKFLIY